MSKTKIYSGKSQFPQPYAETLRDLLDQVGSRYENIPAYIYRKKVRGRNSYVTYAGLRHDVLSLAIGLQRLHLRQRPLRLAVIGENSYPWILAYNAAVTGIGVVVPLDHQLPNEEALQLMRRGKVNVLCYSERHKDLAEAAVSALPALELCVCLKQEENGSEEDPFANTDSDKSWQNTLVRTVKAPMAALSAAAGKLVTVLSPDHKSDEKAGASARSPLTPSGHEGQAFSSVRKSHPASATPSLSADQTQAAQLSVSETEAHGQTKKPSELHIHNDEVLWCSIDELLELGRHNFTEDLPALDALRPKPDDLASIVFTSGTLSSAKGVMFSQRNISSNAHASAESFNTTPGMRALSVLPLHHCFENTVGMFAFWYLGLTICINDGLRYIGTNMKDWHIQLMMSVPLLIENIYGQILRSVRKQKKEDKLRRGIALANFLQFFGVNKRRLIFRTIHEQLGGEFLFTVVGGAALDPKVNEFFRDIGIKCLQGYGLTEASPVVACNTLQRNKIKTVGWALPGVSICIDGTDEDGDETRENRGEILVKGPNVMLGYLDAPELTAETIDSEGWLHTGDIGFIAKDGSLTITGRKKSMLVLSNGKKAFPEEIEALLKRISGVDEAFVWDEESKRGSVIICAKLKVLRHELPELRNGDDDEISRYLREEVIKVNHKMPVYKAITAFIWTEEPLEMTTTLKVRRNVERRRIAEDLALRGLSIQEADGLRLPESSPLHIEIPS